MEWLIIIGVAAAMLAAWLIALTLYDPQEPVASEDDPERNWHR